MPLTQAKWVLYRMAYILAKKSPIFRSIPQSMHEKSRGSAGFLWSSLQTPEYWRMGRDSNPRWSCPHNGFQDRRNRPLCHPSLTLFPPVFQTDGFVHCLHLMVLLTTCSRSAALTLALLTRMQDHRNQPRLSPILNFFTDGIFTRVCTILYIIFYETQWQK